MSASETSGRHLDESIRLELNLARLYATFNDLFAEDEEFWWDLSVEEQGHASLFRQEKEQPQQKEFFPDNLLANDLQALLATNEKIEAIITSCATTPPKRSEAFQIAYDLEMAAGESHFQHFLESPTNSYAAGLFKQLNQQDRDHAERIRDYAGSNGIVTIVDQRGA